MEMIVTHDDGSTSNIDIRPADLIAFERKYDRTWDSVEQNPRVEYTFFLAYNACRRTKQIDADMSFDDFLDQVADLDETEAAKKAAAAPRKRKG